jgi:ABC-type polysaccharide/polyol phosphate transport system ATPase subunit
MIKVEGISKQFKLYRSPADRLKEIVYRRKYHKDFVALDNISFEVKNGETLGIIGQNGAGKSTLLKILSGIVIPDSGTIKVDGKVTGLLELGTGFNAEMTGLENIYMNGTLIGMTKDEIGQKKQAIIDFSELGDFINEPIKTYSSGMTMRLAFSIAIHADPTCFLVDEALSVGDAYFQQKCMRKIQEFRAGGGSIVFVSHDMNAVKTLCDAAIMLDHGIITVAGSPKEVVDYYNNCILKKLHQGDQDDIKIEQINKQGWGVHSDLKSECVEVIAFRILSEKGNEINTIISEENIILDLKFKAHSTLQGPHFGFMVRNKYGQVIFETSSWWLGMKSFPVEANTIIHAQFFMNFPLMPGDYSFSLGIADKELGQGVYNDYLLMLHDLIILHVLKSENATGYSGVFNMKPTISLLEDII